MGVLERRHSIQSLYILPDAQTMPATVGYQTPKCLLDFVHIEMQCPPIGSVSCPILSSYIFYHHTFIFIFL